MAASAAPPPLPTPRRHLVRAGLLLGGLGLLALLGARAYLQTRAGTAWLLRVGLGAANDAIAGRVEAEGATLLDTHLLIRGARLLDPEGAQVAFVEEVQVDLVWAPLLRGHVEARTLLLVRPQLSVTLEADGSNLDRTFAAKHPGPADAAGRPPPLTFVVRRFDVREGQVQLQTPEGPPLLLQDLALSGSGRFGLRSQDFQVQAQGAGAVSAPTPGPLTVALQGEGRGSRLSAEVDVHAAGSSLVADARAGGDALLDGHLALDVSPSFGRALVPGWPLRVPLVASGEARRAGTGGYVVSLQAAAGRAQLTLHTEVDVEHTAARAVRLDVQHVHLAELLGHGPDSDFALRLQGTVRGNSWASARGQLTLDVPPSVVRGTKVGPVQAAVRLEGGRVEVPSLRAVLPGLMVEGSGSGTAHALQATLRLDVTHLAALTDTFGDVGGALPRLSGQGTLRLEVSGRPAHPAVEAAGHFAQLGVGPVSAEDLEVALRLQDASRPLDSNATLTAGTLTLAARALRDVHARLHSEARAVELQATAAGAFQLEAAGTADGDGRGLLLDTLQLRFPEETFALAAPAAVRFAAGRLQMERLELLSGSQSISLRARAGEGQVEGTLQVAHLELAHLPAVVVPASAQLAGVLDVQAEVHGAVAHPDANVRAQLTDGGLSGVRGLSGQLEAGRRGGHLSLHGQLTGLGTSLAVEAEGPELALTGRVHQPLALHLQAEDIDVGRALCEVARAGLLPAGCPQGTAAVAGRAALEARVDGFADAPAVHLLVRAAEVRARGLPTAEGTLRVDADADAPLALSLQAKGLDGSLDVQASLLSTTAQLLARRRSWAGWRTVPLQADVHAAGLRLQPLHEARLLEPAVQGVAAVQLSATGTLGDVRGKAEVQVQQLLLPPWPALDATLSVEATDTVTAVLALHGPGEEKGWAHLQVHAPLFQLLASTSPEELGHAALEVDGELGPFDFRDLPLNANRLRRDRRLLDGQLTVRFQGRGTLLSPAGTATLKATGLGPSDGAHFEGTAHARYAAGQGAADLQLQSESGGTLHLDGTVQMDLSLPSLRRGLKLQEAPLRATLHSLRFEPDFVASLFPWMRSISGKLQIDGEADGTLGQPSLHGALAWTDGEVGIIGFGLYQHIQLRAEASNQRFAIEELSARVQGGTLSLRLEGTRGPEGFRVSGALRTVGLPVVFDDQLWCMATLQADLAGTARPWELDLQRVRLENVELQLPEARRKDLQGLSSPEDVVLTRNGDPLDKAQARRALAMDPRLAGRAAVPDGTPAAGTSFLRVSLQAPQPLWVRGKDMALELGLSDPFQLTLGGPARVVGEVRILRGRGDVWGRRFEVQPGGRVRFDGEPAKAQLDVTGVYQSVLSQAKVYMHFSGEADAVKVTPSSDPPLSESEIYTLLATGRTQLVQSSLGSSTSVGGEQAGASILGSWAATELKKAVGGALPIDVLSVEVNNDERGVNQTRLEAGKYLTDDIYIGYQARINADAFRYQNANAIRVEYRFLRRWSLQLEYGDANAGSLDAVWSRDY